MVVDPRRSAPAMAKRSNAGIWQSGSASGSRCQVVRHLKDHPYRAVERNGQHVTSYLTGTAKTLRILSMVGLSLHNKIWRRDTQLNMVLSERGSLKTDPDNPDRGSALNKTGENQTLR
jgi:hypothetical protein